MTHFSTLSPYLLPESEGPGAACVGEVGGVRGRQEVSLESLIRPLLQFLVNENWCTVH